MERIVDSYKKDLTGAINDLDAVAIATAALVILDTIQNEGTVYVCGNGGSASTASHMVCDLGKNTGKQVRIVSLNDSISTMLAYANDFEFDGIFSEQLANVIDENDCLVAISTSGESRNVLAAICVAETFDANIVALTGRSRTSSMAKWLVPERYCHAQVVFVESDNIGVVEDVHLVINHMITEILRGE